MRMRRSGYRKFHKYTDIITNREADRVFWDSNCKELCLQVRYEPDIYQPNVNYDYDLFLSLPDIAAMLPQLSAAISAMPREIHEGLRSSRSALICITACASGYNLVALPPAP